MRANVIALLIMGLIHAAGPCCAQDKIVNDRGETIEGKIVKVTKDGTPVIRMATGVETAVPKASVRSIKMQPPAGMAEARKALAAGDYAKVLASIKAEAEQFAGLKDDDGWVVEALGMVGDAYLATGDKPASGAIFRKMQTDYANSPYAVKADVGLAKLYVGDKQLDKAEEMLKPILAKAVSSLAPADIDARVFADACLVMGQLAEARGQNQDALEYYLRVVTLYPVSPTVVALADARCKALRQDGTVFVK